MGHKVKLSIIIPCYNAEPYIEHLIQRLKPQITDEVEVIVVDDGSKFPYLPPYENIKVIRKENGGVSSARNVGIDNCTGEYISFIDADDLVAEDFVSQIFSKIPFDYLEMSWKSLPGGEQYVMKLNSVNDSLINPSACTRVFNRAVIGDVRFNELKDSAEDEDFTRHLELWKYKKDVITDFMYFYRTGRKDSGSQKFVRGECKTKRILYYYHHITPDMTWLIDEAKEEDKINEVIIMTYLNELPELAKYAQIKQPSLIRASELRGEEFGGFLQIPQKRSSDIETQVLIYTNLVEKVGGITTWIYNFCRNMSKYYDITVLMGDQFDQEQASRLRRFVQVIKNNDNLKIFCDTVIIQRITDQIPDNIIFKKSIQVVHACSQFGWKVPQDRDHIINVSQYAKDTWKGQCKDSEVIHNLMWADDSEALILVSATRIGAADKGQNDYRMRKLAMKLEESKRPYIWFNFSNIGLSSMPEHFINMPPEVDIVAYIKKADYLVQLSDPVEAFGYSCMEALSSGVPIITTDQPALKELGYIDGVHGHTVPDDMDFDIDILWNIPEVIYIYDNREAIDKWRSVLGDTVPTHSYIYDDSIVSVRVIKKYRDMELDKYLSCGEVVEMKRDRAKYVQSVGYVEVLEG
jgi:glycosyltransferase involved in cell wall biosynthesis